MLTVFQRRKPSNKLPENDKLDRIEHDKGGGNSKASSPFLTERFRIHHMYAAGKSSWHDQAYKKSRLTITAPMFPGKIIL